MAERREQAADQRRLARAQRPRKRDHVAGRKLRGELARRTRASPLRLARIIAAPRGMVRVMLVPLPSADSSSTVPPWASMNWRVSGRPRPSAASPRPRRPDRWKRANTCAWSSGAMPGPSSTMVIDRLLVVAAGLEPDVAAFVGVGDRVAQDMLDRFPQPPRVADDAAGAGSSASSSFCPFSAARRCSASAAARHRPAMSTRSRSSTTPWCRPGSGRARRRSASTAARPIPGSRRHNRRRRRQLAGIARRQHLGEAADRGQRRAQLIAHVGDEVGLDPVGLLQRGRALAQRRLDPAESVTSIIVNSALPSGSGTAAKSKWRPSVSDTRPVPDWRPLVASGPVRAPARRRSD